ncbi:MAG TPA: hypothetical protein VKY74_14000 [Chloroflexia bacterium]|nr:hypothetical protein [Chloroflexia bacterium]
MDTQVSGITPERICQQAQANLTTVVLGTLAYLNEQGLSREEWTTFIGRRLTGNWEELRAPGARAILERIALNLLTPGAELHSLTGDASQATATFGGWLPIAGLDLFGLTQPEADSFADLFRPIVEHLGFHYERTEAGEYLQIRVWR